MFIIIVFWLGVVRPSVLLSFVPSLNTHASLIIIIIIIIIIIEKCW